jgi:hypothetical protein
MMTVAKWRRIALTEITRVVLAANDARSLGGRTKESSAMMQENTGTRAMTQENRSLTTHGTEIEHIHDAAQEDAGFGKILKFKKGDYSINEEEIPLGTKFIAHTRAWSKGWIKFVDGEVTERNMYRVALGEKPPEREELDDQDQDNWPEGLDGKPADPWVYQYLLPFEDPSSGEIVVFVTSSFGGKRAVADLCAAYARRAAKVAGCGQPIIKLQVTDMPTKKFGKVPRPSFEVIGWDEAQAVLRLCRRRHLPRRTTKSRSNGRCGAVAAQIAATAKTLNGKPRCSIFTPFIARSAARFPVAACCVLARVTARPIALSPSR